jgi:polysaccharide pyruvyl transferase WcaK-like protein
MKNFLFVGHGIDKENWGNRGTSLALLELISKRGNISGFVLSHEKNKRLTNKLISKVSGKIAWEAYSYKQLNPSSNASNFAENIFNFFSGIGEFIKETPQESADFVYKNRTNHPFLKSIVERISTADAIVINGEGDMIFTSPPRRTFRFLLVLIALSLKLGKPVYFVNSIASPSPNGTVEFKTVSQAAELLSACVAVSMRDPQSLAFVKNHMPQVHSEYVPDALFLWRSSYFDKMDGKPGVKSHLLPFLEGTSLVDIPEINSSYVVVAGSSRIESSKSQAVESYVNLIRGIKSLGYGVIACQPGDGDEFLKDAANKAACSYVSAKTPILAAAALLAGANAFISGRYHPSILASNGGTPCIFMGSNSHKTSSLQKVLGYENIQEFNCPPKKHELVEMLERIEIVAKDDDLRKRIYNRALGCAHDVITYYEKIFNN